MITDLIRYFTARANDFSVLSLKLTTAVRIEIMLKYYLIMPIQRIITSTSRATEACLTEWKLSRTLRHWGIICQICRG